MTMQPLLIAPDGAINKAMIHTGPCADFVLYTAIIQATGSFLLNATFVLIILIIVTACCSTVAARCFQTDCAHIPNAKELRNSLHCCTLVS